MVLVIILIPFDDRNVYISTEKILVLKENHRERDLSIELAATLDLDTLIAHLHHLEYIILSLVRLLFLLG